MRSAAIIANRVAIAVVTLLGASALIWLLLLIAPGDPAEQVLRARGIQEPDPLQVAAMRDHLGLNGDPLTRFGQWLWGMAQGDLGVSWKSGRPVAEEFASRLPATLRLTLVAMVIAVVLALILGLVSAMAPNRWPDTICRLFSLAMVTVPGFLLGLFLLNVLVLRLGMGRIVGDGTWRTVGWPAFALALGSAGYWSRILRASILEARRAPYLEVSKVRGAGTRWQMLVHVLPNALGPFLTIVGLGAAGLIGGAPIAEAVFSWPGIGAYTVTAINARDQPVIAAFTLISVLIYIVASLIVDLALMALDPRLRRPGRVRRTTALVGGAA